MLGEAGYVSITDGANMENHNNVRDFYSAYLKGLSGSSKKYGDGNASCGSFPLSAAPVLPVVALPEISIAGSQDSSGCFRPASSPADVFEHVIERHLHIDHEELQRKAAYIPEDQTYEYTVSRSECHHGSQPPSGKII